MGNILSMKFLSLHVLLCLLGMSFTIQAQQETRLIVRADDIGSTHGANLGCIQAYQEGIVRSVEIMVPCAWFPEAVNMLKENPGLDVGIHLTFTSEWENVKWRPLSHAPSITDEDGYFFPMIWPSERFPEHKTLKGSAWIPEEIEAEMRAQIELALKHIPQVSHLSCHMGCAGWDEQVAEVYHRLAREYKLDIDPGKLDVKNFPVRVTGLSSEDRINSFIEGLQRLEPGQTYLFVEHPALAGAEMKAVGHEGYDNVCEDRQMVTEMFTSERILDEIERLGIELISYADLIQGK
jgi:predicted glycoside hydrolase/deacetylase ChbG (UPF0249 family)